MYEAVERGSRAVEDRLVRALRGRGGRITRSDAEVLTGLPAPQVEDGLRQMLARYRSHLAATDSGELLYAFDPALERRDAEPLGVRLRRLAAALWRGFVVAFKVAIVVVLVGYVLVFLALLLGLMVARMSGNGNDSDSDDGGFMPLGLIWWLLPWDVGPYAAGPVGRAPRRRRPRGKKVHQQVFDFVFGPPRPREQPGAADQETLAFIRARAGRITAADLVSLHGFELAAAEEEATRLMCDYGGEPEVTEGGVVLYVFRDLRRTAGAGGGGGWRWAWQRLEARPPLTGNSVAADVVVALLNGFTLAAPLVFVAPAMHALGLTSHAAEVWLRVVPFTFAWIFFAVPLGRLAARALRDPARLARNRRRLLLREVFIASDAGGALDPAGVVRTLAAGDAAEEAALKRELDALVGPLSGDVILDAGDERRLGWLSFPRLAAEIEAANRSRALAPAAETEVGQVVFDSAAPVPERN